MVLNWPPKTLKPFVDKGLSVVPKSVEVVAKNSPHKGRPITVYDSSFIESFIRGYALAFANDVLRPNQRHIGKRCVTLQSALTRSAIDIAIKQACGLSPNIQQTAQKNYIDAVKLIKDFGFKYLFMNFTAFWSPKQRFGNLCPKRCFGLQNT